MLNEIAGIDRVRMLYFQLLYRCNFSCRHCFHGDLLKDRTQFTLPEAKALLDHFQQRYRLEAVTFLGGEPLLYQHIVPICRYAHDAGLGVEICTNGHPGFLARLDDIFPVLHKLRVSLDGMGKTHDMIRKPGSFDGAMRTVDAAVAEQVTTGVTMTVTRYNINEIVPLAQLLDRHGVVELKLHCLRLVGNAEKNPDLAVADTGLYGQMHRAIEAANLGIEVIYDSDLSPQPQAETCSNLVADGWLDRIESDPKGGLTVSCKAVGKDVNAFRWDKHSEQIIYEPRENDEFAVGIPDVVYVTA